MNAHRTLIRQWINQMMKLCVCGDCWSWIVQRRSAAIKYVVRNQCRISSKSHVNQWDYCGVAQITTSSTPLNVNRGTRAHLRHNCAKSWRRTITIRAYAYMPKHTHSHTRQLPMMPPTILFRLIRMDFRRMIMCVWLWRRIDSIYIQQFIMAAQRWTLDLCLFTVHRSNDKHSKVYSILFYLSTAALLITRRVFLSLHVRCTRAITTCGSIANGSKSNKAKPSRHK